MPPIQQQQTSRAGLITALVISIIANLGILVFAIMTNAEVTKITQDRDTKLKQYQSVVDESTIPAGVNADMEYLRAQREKMGNIPLIDVANRLRKAVVKLITGSEGPNDQADTAFKQAYDEIASLKSIEALKGMDVPTTSLTDAIKALVKQIRANMDAVAAAQKAAADAADQLKQAQDKYAQELATRDAAVKAEQDAKVKTSTDAQAAIAEKQKQYDDVSKRLTETEEKFNKLAATEEAAKQALQGEIGKLKAEVAKRDDRLAMYKYNVKNAWIRNTDALITQLAPDNRCYINLGFGDHVMPGLTFEVYDKNDGIPPIKDGTSLFEMPKGKGSIEIIDVGQNSSMCRIIVRQPGQQISQGDICANLVYDKNLKPKFFVYGDFDMDNNTVATPAEAEIIKSLILRWGGKLADKLDVDVDFLIVGKEPAIPTHTQEEYNNNAQIKAKVDEAKEKLRVYSDVIQNAGTLHIPVLNQNRFLYYTGYYDAARK